MPAVLQKEGTFATGILGFIRIPTADDPNKVYALGPQGRPVRDPADLKSLMGPATGDPFSYVQLATPEEALSVAVTGFTINGRPSSDLGISPAPTPAPAPTPTPEAPGGGKTIYNDFDTFVAATTKKYGKITPAGGISMEQYWNQQKSNSSWMQGLESFAPTSTIPVQETVDPATTKLKKVLTGSFGPDGEPIYNVFDENDNLVEGGDPRLKGIIIENLLDRPGGAPADFVDKKFEPAPGAIPPKEGEEAPRVFHEFDAYKGLSDDDKLFVDEMFSLVQFGGEQEAQIFANAIKQAKGIADPFFRAKLGLALAETIGKIAEVTGDFETQKEVMERARDELLQDVRRGRDFFTLEQQSDIARLTNSYQSDILQIADLAAEKGLTLATGARSRELAESRRQEQFGDVVESSTRRFNLQIKELELRASRGETEASKQLESLKSQRTLRLESIGRGAEELLGTEGLGGVTGLGTFTPTGGVLGDIEERKRRSLISDTAAFVELQRGFL